MARKQKASKYKRKSSAELQRLRRRFRVKTIADVEIKLFLQTIRKTKGDKILASELLGVGKTSLYRKLKNAGIKTKSVY